MVVQFRRIWKVIGEMLGKKPPTLLNAVALVFVALGIFISPELLIELGLDRVDLTSDNPLIQQIARLEITAYRGLCLITAVVLFGISIWWGRFVESTLFKTIANHPGSYHVGRGRPAVLNTSFYVTFTACDDREVPLQHSKVNIRNAMATRTSRSSVMLKTKVGSMTAPIVRPWRTKEISKNPSANPNEGIGRPIVTNRRSQNGWQARSRGNATP